MSSNKSKNITISQNELCDELAVFASNQKELSVDVFYEKEEEKLL